MKYKESEIIEEGLSPNINVELHTAQMRHDAQLLIDKLKAKGLGMKKRVVRYPKNRTIITYYSYE